MMRYGHHNIRWSRRRYRIVVALSEETCMEKLEIEFTQELLRILDEAEQITGVADMQLKTQIQKHGGVRAIKEKLKRKQISRQFSLLEEKKRLKLSPEYLVIQGKFGALFTDDEVNLCLEVLLEAGAFSQ